MKKNTLRMLIPATLVTLGTTAVSCTGLFEEINRPGGALTKEELMKDNFIGESYIRDMMVVAFPKEENQYQRTMDFNGNHNARYTTNANDKFNGQLIATMNASDGWNAWVYQNSWPVISRNYKSLVDNAGKGSIMELWGSIIRAHAILLYTDTYGPFPIGTEEDPTAFVSQEEVYRQLISELNRVNEALVPILRANPTLTLAASADPAYGGDISKWLRFANSLRLRIALRISKVAPEEARALAEQAIQAGVITDNADNMKTAYDPAGHYKTSVEWGDSRVSADLISYLQGLNDPRLAKMIAKGTNSGDYYGILLGTAIGAKTKADGIYSAPVFAQNEPLVWLSAAEVSFLKAEGALLGWDMGNTPKHFYEEGIRLSFAQWKADGVDAYLSNSNSKPANHAEPDGGYGRSMAAASDITVMWNDSDNPARKLERIITQKWLAVYPNGMEAWSELRRTGYPKVFPLAEATPGYTLNIANRVPYPTDEQIKNPKGYETMLSLLGGTNRYDNRMWWQGAN